MPGFSKVEFLFVCGVILSTHKQLAEKLQELENKLIDHDQAITELIEAIRELVLSSIRKQNAFGFTADIQ